MKLVELITAIKEKNLTKVDLERYRDDLSNVTALMFLEMSDLEKSEALFTELDADETESSRKRRWRKTDQGLRQIELKNYIRASKEILASLKSRLYILY